MKAPTAPQRDRPLFYPQLLDVERRAVDHFIDSILVVRQMQTPPSVPAAPQVIDLMREETVGDILDRYVPPPPAPPPLPAGVVRFRPRRR